jgi:hypothetical protein
MSQTLLAHKRAVQHKVLVWSSCAVVPSVVGAVGRLVGVALPPPEDDRPRDGLQAERDAAERGQDDNVGGLPSGGRLEDVKPLEDVDGGQDDDRVPDGVVVDVPVQPVLVLLVGPQQQREHLERGEAEDGDADVAVGLVGGAHGLAAELEAQAPAGDAEDVAGALAGDVEVEPGGVGGLEHAEVARDHGAQGDQDAPGHSVQHSVDLYVNTIANDIVKLRQKLLRRLARPFNYYPRSASGTGAYMIVFCQ